MNSNIYEEKYNIFLEDVASSGSMKISAIFDCMHDVADRSLIPVKMDKESLEKRGILWVLAEQSAEIIELPKLDDAIKIITWVGNEFYGFIPRFYLIEKNGKAIVKASTVWALIDKENRKSITPESANVKIEPTITGDEIAVLKTLKKLDVSSIYTATVSNENIDFNNHMNNAQYFEIIDKFNPLIKDNGLIHPRYIIARYSKEAFLGDELTIKEGLQDSSRFYTVDSTRGNHLKARIEY